MLDVPLVKGRTIVSFTVTVPVKPEIGWVRVTSIGGPFR
jgi:hypothetical protein